MLTIEKQIEIILLETINNLYPDKELKPIEITVATNEKFGCGCVYCGSVQNDAKSII